MQGHCLIVSVAVNKRMLWRSRQRSRMRLKLYIVITTKVKEKFQQREIGAGEEKAVVNQTENEVESHVNETMESQDHRTRIRW